MISYHATAKNSCGMRYDILRPVARICFGGVRSLERKGYFCQDFFLGGGCVVWRGRGIFARGFLLPLNQYITNSGMIIVFYYRPTQ